MEEGEKVAEQNDNALPHDPEEARWLWEETAAVYRLHAELAHVYMTRPRDRQAIDHLWAAIEEREYALRVLGVEL